MKSLILLVFFICAWSFAPAQVNYVRNPDFEKYDTCPYKNDQINLVKHWTSVDSTYNISTHGNCSSEYYNLCANAAPVVYFGIPYNQGGYQYPRSGNGKIGSYMFCDESPSPPPLNTIIEIMPNVVCTKPLLLAKTIA